MDFTLVLRTIQEVLRLKGNGVICRYGVNSYYQNVLPALPNPFAQDELVYLLQFCKYLCWLEDFPGNGGDQKPADATSPERTRLRNTDAPYGQACRSNSLAGSR